VTTIADETHLSIANQYGTDGIIYVTMPQYEKKDYRTSFVYGSRASNTGYYIDNPVTSGEFTISFKCRINTNITSPISYQTVLSMGSYYTNNSFTIMDNDGTDVGGNQKLIRKGNGGE